MDHQYIIDATHGKRCADNVAHFKPYLKEHEIDGEVTKFEETALFFSDAYKLFGPGSKIRDPSGRTPIDQTPSLTSGSCTPFSVSSINSKRSPLDSRDRKNTHDVAKNIDLEKWQLEATNVDRHIQILPGVKRLIDSIPVGRYAVATSATTIFGNFFTCLIFSWHWHL